MSDIKDFNRMFSLDGKVALVTGGKVKQDFMACNLYSDSQVLGDWVCTLRLHFSSLEQRRFSSPRVRTKESRALTKPSRNSTNCLLLELQSVSPLMSQILRT